MNSNEVPRIVVLIDAENVSATLAKSLKRKVATLGAVRQYRCFGGKTASTIDSWRKELAEPETRFVWEFPQTKGPNAADILLTIVATELARAQAFGGIVIVSSDSDFQPLLAWLKEIGCAAWQLRAGDLAEPAKTRAAAPTPAPPAAPQPKEPGRPRRPRATKAQAPAKQIQLELPVESEAPVSAADCRRLTELFKTLRKSDGSFPKGAFGERLIKDLKWEFPRVGLGGRKWKRPVEMMDASGLFIADGRGRIRLRHG